MYQKAAKTQVKKNLPQQRRNREYSKSLPEINEPIDAPRALEVNTRPVTTALAPKYSLKNRGKTASSDSITSPLAKLLLLTTRFDPLKRKHRVAFVLETRVWETVG